MSISQFNLLLLEVSLLSIVISELSVVICSCVIYLSLLILQSLTGNAILLCLCKICFCLCQLLVRFLELLVGIVELCLSSVLLCVSFVQLDFCIIQNGLIVLDFLFKHCIYICFEMLQSLLCLISKELLNSLSTFLLSTVHLNRSSELDCLIHDLRGVSSQNDLALQLIILEGCRNNR